MYMQRLVVDISQQIEQVEIPSKFFEHRKNDGTWSETTAEILRKFERSEFCAPLSDYLNQMAQFEKVIETTNGCCATFFQRAIKSVMNDAVSRQYSGPQKIQLTLAPENDTEPLLTSAMTVLRVIQDAKLHILRKNGTDLMTIDIFKDIGLIYSENCKTINPDTLVFRFSDEFFCWCWLCCQAKRGMLKHESQIISAVEESGFQKYCENYGTPQLNQKLIQLMNGTRERPSTGKIEVNGQEYCSIELRTNPKDLFGYDMLTFVTDREEYQLEEGDKVIILDENNREHKCIIQKSDFGAWYLILDVLPIDEEEAKWADSYQMMLDSSVPCRLPVSPEKAESTTSAIE